MKKLDNLIKHTLISFTWKKLSGLYKKNGLGVSFEMPQGLFWLSAENNVIFEWEKKTLELIIKEDRKHLKKKKNGFLFSVPDNPFLFCTIFFSRS